MKLPQSSLSVLASLLCLVSLSGIGCGGSGHNSGPTATIAVLRGDKNAMANPVGADGLTPVGAGFAVTSMYFSDNIAAHSRSQVSTNSSGRVVVDASNTAYDYYYFAADQCSTVVAISYNPDVHAPSASYDSTPHFNDLVASDAMKQKASLAAKALGVDAVVLVGTDADVCTAQ